MIEEAKPDIMVMRSKTSTGISKYQLARELSQKGNNDLPGELQKMILSQTQQLNFLSSQVFVLFPYKKDQGNYGKKEREGKEKRERKKERGK